MHDGKWLNTGIAVMWADEQDKTEWQDARPQGKSEFVLGPAWTQKLRGGTFVARGEAWGTSATCHGPLVTCRAFCKCCTQHTGKTGGRLSQDAPAAHACVFTP